MKTGGNGKTPLFLALFGAELALADEPGSRFGQNLSAKTVGTEHPLAHACFGTGAARGFPLDRDSWSLQLASQ